MNHGSYMVPFRMGNHNTHFLPDCPWHTNELIQNKASRKLFAVPKRAKIRTEYIQTLLRVKVNALAEASSLDGCKH